MFHNFITVNKNGNENHNADNQPFGNIMITASQDINKIAVNIMKNAMIKPDLCVKPHLKNLIIISPSLSKNATCSTIQKIQLILHRLIDVLL